MEKKIQKLPPNPKGILSQTVENIAAGIVGISDFNRDKLILSASHLVKSLIKGKLLDGLNQEWSSYVEEGRIKADFDFSPEHYNTMAEMLDYLDNGVPNDKVFGVMRKIFFTTILEEKQEDDSLLPYEYMRIAKELSSVEILVLTTIRKMYLNEDFTTSANDHTGINYFFSKIADKTGLRHIELLGQHMESLYQKDLLPGSFSSNSAASQYNKSKCPTNLGMAFCSYIEKYDELTK